MEESIEEVSGEVITGKIHLKKFGIMAFVFGGLSLIFGSVGAVLLPVFGSLIGIVLGAIAIAFSFVEKKKNRECGFLCIIALAVGILGAFVSLITFVVFGLIMLIGILATL